MKIPINISKPDISLSFRNNDHFDSRVLASLLVAASFTIPFLIVLFSLAALHVLPFGEHNLAISDGGFYLNGMVSLGRTLHQGNDLFYSFSGIGSNNWASLAWGGLTPTRVLLSLFATVENVPELFDWLCVINISVCGLTMYILLADVRGHRVDNLIFSLSYALCGFNVAFCYHHLFLIGPQLLPLVVVGMKRMLSGRSPIWYVVPLATCSFINFYFAFFIAVFSFLLFLVYMYVNWEVLAGKRAKLFIGWASASIVSAMIAAPMWLPALKAYMGGGRIDQAVAVPLSYEANMPLTQIPAKLFSGANSTAEQVDGLPNIFCGILPIALVILYFFDEKNPICRRQAAMFIIILYIISFWWAPLTRLMHGGTHTNWFNYRYSFVFIFILILISVEEYPHIYTMGPKQMKQAWFTLVMMVLLTFSTTYDFVSPSSVVIDLSLFACMCGGLWLWKNNPHSSSNRILTILLILLTSINLYANTVMSIYKVQEWELDLEDYRNNALIDGGSVDAINSIEQGYFRMEKEISRSGSMGADAGLYGYHGLGGSGPTIRSYIHTGLNRLGLNWYDMRHWYSDGVPAATDSLLGLRYILAERDLTTEKGYEKLTGNGQSYIYKNPYELPIVILANSSINDIKLNDNAFINQNRIWCSITGVDKEIFTFEDDITYSLHNLTDQQVLTSKEIRRFSADNESSSSSILAADDDIHTSAWIEVTFVADRDGTIYRFDSSVPASNSGSSSPSVKCIGWHAKGDVVTDTLEAPIDYATPQLFRTSCSGLSYAYADNETLKILATEIQSRDNIFEISESDSCIIGQYTANENQRLLVTVPWDEGWSCFIDGQEVCIDKTIDLFMSVAVPQGSHSYEFRFRPALLDVGLLLCLLGMLILIIIIVCWKRTIPLTNHKE